MANKSEDNVKGLFQGKNARVAGVLAVGGIAAGLVIASMTTSNQQSRPAGLPASVEAPTAPSTRPIPGTSTSEKHNESVRQENREAAAQAAQTGQSVVPRLTNPADDKGKDPFDIASKKGPDAKLSDVSVPTPAVPVRPVVVASAPALIQQPVVAQPVQKAPGVAEQEKEMSKAMIGLLNSWSPAPQQIEVQYVYKGEKTDGLAALAATRNGGSSAAVDSATAAATTSSNSPSKKVAIKAGSILHAVVITSVNSDEPGPVLAQVTTGPYSGGRLIGKFELPKDSDKMVLSFSTLTMQNADKSYALSGFAIDPETARTALGSDVDHHYLSRYGMFSAATFLKGYSAALTQQGTQQTATTGAGGLSVTTAYPVLSTKDIAISALGAVGAEVASSLKDGLKRPPTVTLNSGTEIGVLVMQDTSF